MNHSNKNNLIAIVGIGCRFPGSSSSPEKFWRMLVNKVDTIIDIPLERWDSREFYSGTDGKPGKMRHKQGGFLTENIMRFDPLFFNISPRESETLDPQQRMLLEISYEALEDAGITLEAIKGSKTGVFIGGFIPENLLIQTADRYQIKSHTITGSAMTMLSNRLSYFYDLKGPSLSIDTACSSSLVAVHYACQSIWNGEISTALVGGVNYMLSPESSLLMSKGQFLSPHSRCKAFDSDAGGYVRGEGAGIVILKSLDQALKDQDKIYATIAGTGVNQDGETNGITVPNGTSQLQLIRETYDKYHIDKEKIHYIEAHGTGTPVGDPIEFKALNEALSDNGNREFKCLVGSVKTNIGHLEAASGIAGLIKTALCLYNNAVPANLHFNNPNPALNYENSCLKIPVSLENLPEGYDSFASVNSFGFGGTNAHVVLKQYDPNRHESLSAELKSNQFIFPISAKNVSALKKLAAEFRMQISEYGHRFDEILSNAIYRRSRLSQRLAIFATSSEDLVEKLEAFEENLLLKGVNQGNIVSDRPKLVFVYTGMGPQWWKMGRELMVREPIFDKTIQDCDRDFKEISGWSIYEELKKPMELSKIQNTNIAQPANFVIQVALTRLLEYYGITADAVVGHSVGEVTSTYISGSLSLKDALTVSYHRSRLQHLTSGMGTMLAVGLPETEVIALIKPYEGISIAAINSEKSVTLSGETSSLKMVMEIIESKGAFCKMLDVTVPYHSPIMNTIKEELLFSLRNIQGTETKIDLYSTVTGKKISGSRINGSYWWKNVRQPVLFSNAIKTLMQDKYNIFIEIGPHPVLRNSMQECIKTSNDFYFLQTLNKNEPEQQTFFDAIAKLFTLGLPIKWNRWIDKSVYMKLPTYPWQKEYLWKNPQRAFDKKSTEINSILYNAKVASPDIVYEFELNEFFFPFLNDHKVYNKVIFPGAGYICMAIAIYQIEISPTLPWKLDNIKFNRALHVNDNEIQKLRLSSSPNTGYYDFKYKQGLKDSSWMKMSSGKFSIGNYITDIPPVKLNDIYFNLHISLQENEIYERLNDSKLKYGLSLRCIKEVKLGLRELLAKIVIHPDMAEYADDYFIHPTLLDACFQSIIILFNGDCVPVSIGKIHGYARPNHEVMCYTKLKFSDKNTIISDLIVCNEEGIIYMKIDDIKCQPLIKDIPHSDDSLKGRLFQTKWIKSENPINLYKSAQNSITYIFTNTPKTFLPIQELTKNSIIVEPGEDTKKLNEKYYQINLQNRHSIDSLWQTEEYDEINLVFNYPLITMDNPDQLSATQKCLKQINPLLNIIQSLSEVDKKIKLILITTEGQEVTEDDSISSLENSVLYGLGRSIVNELSNYYVRLIDLEKNVMKNETIWQVVTSLIYGTDNHVFEELALRNGKVFQKKIFDVEINEHQLLKSIGLQAEALRLKIPIVSGLKSFCFENTNRIAPQANEVEILIDCAPITNQDFLQLSGNVSDNIVESTFSGNKLGNECVGTISRIGSNVSKFKKGDRVMALAPGTLQTFTTTPESLAVKCPLGVDATASGVIMSYITAIHCLKDKANLQKGNSVLIHNAAHGVGLAAIYYAKNMEAEIFATAEFEEDRTYLKSIGINYIFNSKNLDLFDEIKIITNNRGVDIILSNLSGELIYQNFSCLASYGVYIDLNRNNSDENIALGMSLLHHNFSYVSVDIERMVIEKQDIVSHLLDTMAKYLDSGCLPVLPIKSFPANQISAAFRSFEKSRLSDKVLIDFVGQTVEVPEIRSNIIKSDGTYLITGGTKGLGLVVARWLIEKGARNLALISRSGLCDNNAKATIEVMRNHGVNICVYASDVSSYHDLKETFDKMNTALPPVTGIFHGAMVLDDGYLMDMTTERFRTVLSPKIDGAMNLHELSKEMKLDFFILFSSISSLIGNMGQANYVAANSYLDSFALWRKKMGFVATVVNLGLLVESGIAARNENLVNILKESGINGISDKQLLQGLDLIIQDKPTQIALFNLNWNLFFKNGGKVGQAFFSELNKTNSNLIKEQLSEMQVSNRKKLLNLESNLRHDFVTKLLQELLGKILRISTEKVSSDKGINLLGVDSILTVELMVAIRNSLAVEIPPIEFLIGPSLKKLSTKVLDKLLQSNV